MPLRVELPPTFADRLLADGRDRALAGMWVCSGSPLMAELVAGGGLDWLMIDAEHSPLGLESIQHQLMAAAPYPTTPVVRVPVNDTVLIKQYLDLGAQNLLVPMVNTAAEAEQAVAALFPRKDWTMLSHVVIFHGRRTCHARRPACGACPVARLCPSYGTGETDPDKAARLLKYELAPDAREKGITPNGMATATYLAWLEQDGRA